MTELPWGTPANIGRLTPAQLACLVLEKPPGGRSTCRSNDEFLAALKRQEREREAWGG